MRWTILLASLLIPSGCEESKREQKGSAPTKAGAKAESPPKPLPQVNADAPKPAPAAKPQSFDGDWAQAETESKRLDEQESQETEAALRLLTAFEAGEARLAMRSWETEKSKASLIRLGLKSWLKRRSRASALAAESRAHFGNVARVVWNRTPGSPVIVHMLDNWELLPPLTRDRVVAAILNGTPASELDPATRDEVVQLAGPGWFTSKR